MKHKQDVLGSNIAKSDDPSVSSGAYLFKGDSISQRILSDGLLANAVVAEGGKRPIIIDKTVSGTTFTVARTNVESEMAAYPSSYVILAYGTNDRFDAGSTSRDDMNAVIEAVITAGRIPVLPRPPWNPSRTDAKWEQVLADFDAAYFRYPQLVKGPDFYLLTKDLPGFIGPDKYHPSDPVGYDFMGKTWASWFARQRSDL